VMEGYFREGLATATGRDQARMLVFYCLRDCWMGWNAAKRAISMGYRRVAWYPDGTDGWEEAKLPLERRDPVPRPGE
jgi:PQQ-dependent catabolism-associated CXXCW motif protein